MELENALFGTPPAMQPHIKKRFIKCVSWTESRKMAVRKPQTFARPGAGARERPVVKHSV